MSHIIVGVAQLSISIYETIPKFSELEHPFLGIMILQFNMWLLLYMVQDGRQESSRNKIRSSAGTSQWGFWLSCVKVSPLVVRAASSCGGAVPKANIGREVFLHANTYHLSILRLYHTDKLWAKLLRPWHIPESLWKGDFPTRGHQSNSLQKSSQKLAFLLNFHRSGSL